jgi:hypothetical protein
MNIDSNAIDVELATAVKGADARRALAAQVQAELKRAGLLNGAIDGVFGQQTRTALGQVTPEITAAHPGLAEALGKIDTNSYNPANRRAIEAARTATQAAPAASPETTKASPEASARQATVPATASSTYTVGATTKQGYDTVYEIANSWSEANPEKVGQGKEFRNPDAVRQWIVKENGIKQRTGWCDGKKVDVDVIRPGMVLTLPEGNAIGTVDQDACKTCEVPEPKQQSPAKAEPHKPTAKAEPHKPTTKPSPRRQAAGEPERARQSQPIRNEQPGICSAELIDDRIRDRFPNINLEKTNGVYGDPRQGRVTVLGGVSDDMRKQILKAAGNCRGRVGFERIDGGGSGGFISTGTAIERPSSDRGSDRPDASPAPAPEPSKPPSPSPTPTPSEPPAPPSPPAPTPEPPAPPAPPAPPSPPSPAPEPPAPPTPGDLTPPSTPCNSCDGAGPQGHAR